MEATAERYEEMEEVYRAKDQIYREMSYRVGIQMGIPPVVMSTTLALDWQKAIEDIEKGYQSIEDYSRAVKLALDGKAITGSQAEDFERHVFRRKV